MKPHNPIALSMTIMIVAGLIFGALVYVVATNWDMVQSVKWKYRATQEPGRYSKCLVCYELKPHKIMWDYGISTWVCDICIASYHKEAINVRIEEELARGGR